MRAVIAHCWQGAPDIGWYPSAAQAMCAQGLDVRVPELPDPDSPRLDEWLHALSAAADGAGDGLLLVGHSLGAVAALHWLSRLPESRRIEGLLLVAPPLHSTGIVEVDAFLAPAPDAAAARRRTRNAAVLVSDSDRYLLPDPREIAEQLALAGYETLVSPGRGHFAPASGIIEVPEVIAWTARLAVS